MRFSTRNRLDAALLNPRLCQELAERGCVLMSAGYETNSQRLLDRLQKGVKASHYPTIFANMHAAGIPLRLSIMGGILDETETERAQSEAFLREYSNTIGIDIMQMLVIEPGTQLWREPESFGLHLPPGDELRGNSLLNYGMGRMGARFEWSDGEDFDARLNRFVGIFYNVHPQKNDEIPPHRQRPRRVGVALKTEKIVLLPWIRLVSMKDEMGSTRNIAIDLMWQRFYEIPSDWGLNLDEHGPDIGPCPQEALRKLIDAGLARIANEGRQ